MDIWRQTGRTTEMLKAALNCDRDVALIFSPNWKMAHHLMDMLLNTVDNPTAVSRVDRQKRQLLYYNTIYKFVTIDQGCLEFQGLPSFRIYWDHTCCEPEFATPAGFILLGTLLATEEMK